MMEHQYLHMQEQMKSQMEDQINFQRLQIEQQMEQQMKQLMKNIPKTFMEETKNKFDLQTPQYGDQNVKSFSFSPSSHGTNRSNPNKRQKPDNHDSIIVEDASDDDGGEQPQNFLNRFVTNLVGPMVGDQQGAEL